MKTNWPLKASAAIYTALALLILLVLPWWSKVTGKSLDGVIVATALLLACICFFLSYSAFRVRSGSFGQRRNFAVMAGIFCGVMAGLAGWTAGVIFGIPLLIAVLGMPELWKSHKEEGATE